MRLSGADSDLGNPISQYNIIFSTNKANLYLLKYTHTFNFISARLLDTKSAFQNLCCNFSQKMAAKSQLSEKNIASL